ncbi:Synaptonemal complex protein SC65 [Acipenser ruthenus]|uniref:Synaptonemal complex protein SC65 n=1 Tax=Acipenser ruthenus TaxID=7906 RepID=A0A444ULP6_ACIRT|nr:cartilage-associated protein-like [Acipenser ruthenus]RXM36112.1 Synaptonemal complex protein SC65 [Acipenser ruthenus]
MEPHRKNASKTLVYFCVCAALFVAIEAQYEKYSFRSYPQSELMPLETAYGYALDQYAAENWKDSIKYLEMSLRIHRLLKDSESFCSHNCSKVGRDQQDALLVDSELRAFNHVLQRAFCLKKCKASSPVFSVAYPRKDILDAFYNRMPYRYLQFAYFQGNNLEKAVSAAHTFLQRNPEDPMMLKNLNYFKTLFEVDEYLIDLEEQPYQSLFVKSVKLYNAGDFRSSIAGMEQAVSEYFQVYELCLAACEGAHEVREFKDFYPAVADHYTDVLECKVKCEGSLAPNVGGFFVEKFVATMYHYLQFTYYKLNDVKNAAPCAASYLLFDSQDEIMLQNMVYYRFYWEQWGLEDNDFRPRPEALQYFNQTTMQKQMLEFAQHYLQSDDEDVVSPEMTEISSDEPPDSEFEGVGDYEESIYAKWWQEPKSKGDAGEPYV